MKDQTICLQYGSAHTGRTRQDKDGKGHPVFSSGDIVLFESTGSVADRVICAATRGPYVHVEVIVAGDDPRHRVEVESVAALSGGVVRHPLPWRRRHVAFPTAARCDPARLPNALAWLQTQVGDGYSVLDLAADALKVYLPAWLGSRTPFLVAPSAFDCSHLAATFLAMAGYPLPPALVADLARTSPNDLARAVGLLP